jgi:hypothetical protein
MPSGRVLVDDKIGRRFVEFCRVLSSVCFNETPLSRAVRGFSVLYSEYCHGQDRNDGFRAGMLRIRKVD